MFRIELGFLAGSNCHLHYFSLNKTCTGTTNKNVWIRINTYTRINKKKRPWLLPLIVQLMLASNNTTNLPHPTTVKVYGSYLNCETKVAQYVFIVGCVSFLCVFFLFLNDWCKIEINISDFQGLIHYNYHFKQFFSQRSYFCIIKLIISVYRLLIYETIIRKHSE